MALAPFTRRFPTEIEHEILYFLGQSDLTRTALVCRDFKDLSTPLMLRHIARWAVQTDMHGAPNYLPLSQSHTVFRRLSSAVQLAIHVRYLDIATTYLCDAALPPVSIDELRTIWTGMRNLVALRLKGPTPPDAELGLTDVRFPLLRRLHVDRPDACPNLIPRHLDVLTHLRVERGLVWTGVCPAHLTHYEGSFLPILHHFVFDSLEHCIIKSRLTPDVAHRVLAVLSQHRNLRVLVLAFVLSDTQIGAAFEGCPRFASIRDVIISYGDKDVRHRREPPIATILAPFPTARRVCMVDHGWQLMWAKDRSRAWADMIAQACRDIEVVLGSGGPLSPVAGSGWQVDDSVWDYSQLSAPLAVPAVPY